MHIFVVVNLKEPNKKIDKIDQLCEFFSAKYQNYHRPQKKNIG